MNTAEKAAQYHCNTLSAVDDVLTSHPSLKPLPLVQFDDELAEYINALEEDPEFVAEVLNVASEETSAARFGLAVISIIEAWQDCLRESIQENNECAMCHGSGGVPEHPCISCGGSGERREYEIKGEI